MSITAARSQSKENLPPKKNKTIFLVMIIVQLGTNTGDDHVLQLCKRVNPDFVLLVEPFSVHNEIIRENYKDIKNYIIENIVISEKENEMVDFYWTEYDGKMKGPECSYMVSSLDPQHIIKHHYPPESVVSFKVKSITINTLFKQYNLKEIDYLFIDIEGADFNVLKMIDFDTYKIKNIQIENLHLNTTELHSFMKYHNYSQGTSLEPNFDVLFYKNQ